MPFNIRMGVPDMEAVWNDFAARKQNGTLDKDEERFLKKWTKALGYLSVNPRHNSLGSHEIEPLTRKVPLRFRVLSASPISPEPPSAPPPLTFR